MRSLIALSLLLSVGLVGCGRDGFGLGDGVLDDEDAGITGDGGPDRDGAVTDDGGFGPDVFPPDSGSRPDATPLDTGLRPDATPLDTGLRPDSGEHPDATTPDTGFRPDAAFPDSGERPDGFVPVDGNLFDTGLRPDTGLFPDTGLPDTGLRPDTGLLPDASLPCPGGCGALDDACNVGVCGPDGRCIAQPLPPPAGDSCLAPLPLTIAPGAQSQAGSTACAQDDAAPQCAPPGGADLVFESTFTETRRVVLETVTPMSGTPFDTAIYVSRDTCATSTQAACNDDFGGSGLSRIDTVLSGGRYFFAVDGASASARGPFELLVDVDPHDTCRSPSFLPVPALGQTVTVRGNTRGNAGDFVSTCAGGSGPDQVWALTITQPVTLRLQTVAPGNAPQFDTVLHVRSGDCRAGMTVACDDDGAGAGGLSRIERSFTPGTYFVIVDGFGAASGEYRLDVTQGAPLLPTILPQVGDARQPLMGPMTSAGQFVEGIRFFMLTQASRLEIALQVTNNLTCGVANFRVRLNNVDVGSFAVRPNTASVSQTLSFPAVNGPNGRFNIRYELQASVPANCGSIQLPDGVSTVALGP